MSKYYFKISFYALQVEQFKKNQLGHHSLHVKFNVNTGDPVASDSDWAHLQVWTISWVITIIIKSMILLITDFYTLPFNILLKKSCEAVVGKPLHCNTSEFGFVGLVSSLVITFIP